uniref:Uncharacterized protein n=1 Tax=Eutreptiella gymnastica TaxID=73025 RepID=A0A7S4LMK7_9EUGL|mmetsp:Transcript_74526/g.124150  ORF Transcript_74526/g.124150 Transcript_74526/m.124150 type:complete len:104 (+) Transcript_74526:284-595(+)
MYMEGQSTAGASMASFHGAKNQKKCKGTDCIQLLQSRAAGSPLTLDVVFVSISPTPYLIDLCKSKTGHVTEQQFVFRIVLYVEPAAHSNPTEGKVLPLRFLHI